MSGGKLFLASSITARAPRAASTAFESGSWYRAMIADGRLHKRTVVHSEAEDTQRAAAEFAREVHRCLRDGRVDVAAFLVELKRLNPKLARHSQGMSGIKSRSTGRPSRK